MSGIVAYVAEMVFGGIWKQNLETDFSRFWLICLCIMWNNMPDGWAFCGYTPPFLKASVLKT
jgi:hypothetical protein